MRVHVHWGLKGDSVVTLLSSPRLDFPIKAVQTVDTSTSRLTNGIFWGDSSVLKFEGPFEFIPPQKLEFDFESIELFGK